MKTAATIAKHIFLTLAVIVGLSLPVRAEIIKIAGSGQMLPLAAQLAQAFTRKYPNDTVLVNPKSLGQKGGIQALVEGSVDIATSARRLDDEERQHPVRSYEIASVAGVFAVHPSVTVENLTSKRICDIYSGRITNWKWVGGPDAPIVVFTRPEDDSTKIVMRRRLPGFAKVHEAPSVIVKKTSKENIMALMSTPYSIGMTDVINVTNADGKIRALRLDRRDITSSVSGPIQHYYQLVLMKNPRPVEMKFMEFVRSPEGQAIIKQNKAHPLDFDL